MESINKNVRTNKIGKVLKNHYRIEAKEFPDGTDREVIFLAKKISSNEILKISAMDLFKNDELLEKFSVQDIKEVSYAAAWQMFLLEKSFKKS